VGRNYKKRRIGLIENGSWSPMAAAKIRALFEKSPGIEFLEPTVRIYSAMKEENEEQIRLLARAIKGE